jgi:hypothetical protein
MAIVRSWHSPQPTDPTGPNPPDPPEVNLAPTAIIRSSTSFAENSTAGTQISTFAFTDPNPSDTTFDVAISGADASLFEWEDSSAVAVATLLRSSTGTASPGTVNYTITVTDSGGLSYQEAFAHTVTAAPAANLAPSAVGLTALTLAQGSTAGTSIAFINVTDPNSSDITFNYSLSGADSTLCSLSSTSGASGTVALRYAGGTLTVANPLDVTITVDDGALSLADDFEIEVDGTLAWNANDKHSDFTLSGSFSQTATRTGGTGVGNKIRSFNSFTSQKIYFEFTDSVIGGAAQRVGIAASTVSLTGDLGAATNTLGYQTSGTVRIDSDSNIVATIQARSASDVTACAIDFSAGKIWFKNLTDASNWNNSGTADPATGTEGISFTPGGLTWHIAYSTRTLSDAVLLNVGQAAFTGTEPTGFTAADGGGETPDPEDPPLEDAFYVSPTGSDLAAGGLATPVATLSKGFQLAAASGSTKVIYLRGNAGTHYVSSTISLTSSHNNIKLKAYPGERPRVSGGQLVTGFASIGSGKYSATLSGGHPGLGVTIGGITQWPARKGTYDPNEAQHTSAWYFCGAGGNGKTTFVYRGTDLSASDFVSGVTICEGAHSLRYSSSVAAVTAINTSTKVVTLSTAGTLNNQGIFRNLGDSATYRLFLNPTYLVNEGEFAYTGSALLVMPQNPSTFESDGVVVARLDNIITATGVSGFEAIGITFTDTKMAPNAVKGLGAISLRACTTAKIIGCRFFGVGQALDVSGGSGGSIAYNEAGYLGQGFVYFHDNNGSPTSWKVYRNSVHDTGLFGDKEKSGVFAQNAVSSINVAHNHFRFIARSAVQRQGSTGQTGWTIEYNRVWDTMLDTADGAALYSYSAGNRYDQQAIIRGNDIRRTKSLSTLKNGTWGPGYQFVTFIDYGIYTDGAASGHDISGNLIYDYGHAGCFDHGGNDNLWNNNFVIQTRGIPTGLGQLSAWRGLNNSASEGGTAVSASDYSRNISYAPVLTPFTRNHMDGPGTITRANNVVFRYVATGDTSSVVADPLFTDFSGGDFSLQASSPAFAEGIVDLECSKMGVDGWENGNHTTYPDIWTGTTAQTPNIPTGAFNPVSNVNLPTL